MEQRSNLDKIEDILGEMEEILEDSHKLPMTDKVMVNRDEMMDMITDIRLKMPGEIEESKNVLGDRDHIIDEAKSEAEKILKQAEEEAARKVDESEITAKAIAQAEVIVSEAKKVATELKIRSREYADDLLAQMSEQLKQLRAFIQSSLGELSAQINKENDTLENAIVQKTELIAKNREELGLDK